jgi:hypothetical protein
VLSNLLVSLHIYICFNSLSTQLALFKYNLPIQIKFHPTTCKTHIVPQIPTAAATTTRGLGPNNHHQGGQNRQVMLLHQNDSIQSKDPILSTLHKSSSQGSGTPSSYQQLAQQQQGLGSILSQFNGDLKISPEMLLQALDPTYNKDGNGNGET